MEQKLKNSNNNKEERTAYSNTMGVPVHSQVRKIKQESEKIMDNWLPGQAEMRPMLREISRQQLSRSPLGLAAARPISVGDL